MKRATPAPPDLDPAYWAAALAQRRAQKQRRARRKKPASGRESLQSPMQRKGLLHEDEAVAYLAQRGVRCVARNVTTRFGELDLIARDGRLLLFIEVRYRSHAAFGGAAASVTPAKQQRLRKAAALYYQRLPTPRPACRFDVIAISATDINWIQHAF